MNKISERLKITFLVHFVVGFLFGLIDLLIPELWGNLTNWPVQDPTWMTRVDEESTSRSKC
jgi:hypothetical protein